MSLFQARTHDTRDTDVASFATYEEYLESQVTAKDRYYLQDDDLARQLVELGYRGHGFTLKRDEFMQRKRDMLESTKPKERKAQQTLCSAGKDLSAHRLLKALADREEDIRNGKLTTIVFIRDRNAKGHEVSGYIDYAQRLKVDDFEQYFLLKKRFLPRTSDLSYYNWDTQLATSTPSSNFQVIDSHTGILFKNKRDRKVINVDPKGACGDNSTRTVIATDEYVQAVIYDHTTRRKSD
ncbi:Cilia- and flagella-associated protein 299 [Plasmodiophora brassicae]|uniref:Cilia- and flagella-associated protein 299 n=1 Tax=Plasmodiophora brassicae TaxID=37360 RepID=A0A0G4IWK0_PLABS|nr:hypothetical protein PBRA_007426 [Plasmodiophora brassicae]SPQ97980.1 unnamed protein product [Plasmodiophora brassicae]